MTYSTIFNPERYRDIQRHLDALGDLPEGQFYELSGSSPKELQKARLLVYDWLHHMGLKGSFRIRTFGSALLVERIGRLTGLTGRLLQRGISPRLDKAIQQALGAKNPAQELKQAVQRGQISQEELGEGLGILAKALG